MTQILDAVKERANNSVSGPFTLLFAFFNWPIILHATTGNSSAIERISSIQTYILTTQGVLWKPIVATLIYLFFMPIIISVVEYWQNIVSIRKENKIEEKTLEESKLWSPVFEKMAQIANKAHESLNYYENHKNMPGQSLDRMRKCMGALALNDRVKIVEEYKKLKLEGIL